MKKTIVLSVLSLFILSVFSSAGLGETRSTLSVDAEASVEADSKNSDSDTSADKSDTEVSTETRTETKRTESDRMEQRKESILTIRSRQRAHFQTAIERCEDTPNPDECKANMEKRLSLVTTLEEKDLANLERFQQKRAEVTERLEELKQKEHFKQFKANAKARIVAAKVMGDAEVRFKDSAKKFDDAEKSRKERLGKFEDDREQWKKDCKNEETEKCKELNKQLTLHVKVYLTHMLEVITSHIEKIEARVTASEHLSEEEAADMLEKLAATKTEVTAVKAKVDVLSETSTKDEIKAVTQEVKRLWSSLKDRLAIHADKVVNARMGGIIVQSEQLRVKLAKVLERMTEKGVDTAATASLVAQFDAKLIEAKEAYESSQTLLKEASSLTGEQRAAKVKEAQTMMKTAKAALKSAHNFVQKIHQELKAQRQTETLAEVETEVEVEAEATAEATTE